MRICLANALILALRRAGPQVHALLAQRLVVPLLAALEARREPSSHVRAALLQACTSRLTSPLLLSSVHASGPWLGHEPGHEGRVHALRRGTALPDWSSSAIWSRSHL